MIKNLRAYTVNINLFVAVVLFLNAITPLSVVAKELSSSGDTGIEALYGDKILICTPAGFKYVSIDELNNLDSSGQNVDQSHCPLCQISVFSTILFLVDISSFNAFSAYSLDQEIYTENDLLLSLALASNIKARAPPNFL